MIEVRLAQFGMGMADGTVIAWLKAEGDTVAQGDILCEVEAAKATVEIEAPRAGVLRRVRVPAGENVPVNTVLAEIEPAD